MRLPPFTPDERCGGVTLGIPPHLLNWRETKN
jgi:hypothetical protein